MARLEVVVEESSREGVAVGSGEDFASTVGDGFKFKNDGKTLILVRNVHATIAYDVTFLIQHTIDGFKTDDRVVEVPALAMRVFGPFSPVDYNFLSGSDAGFMFINIEDASIQVQCIRDIA